MANEKLTELTKVASVGDNTLFYLVDPNRTAGDQSVSMDKEDVAALVGSSPIATNPVENEYADIASMLADQSNQTEGFFQYVIDDGTGNEAYYEKLAASTSNISDYRKLSDEEITVVEGNRGFKVFRVQTISDSTITSASGGRIGIEYNNANDLVTGFLLNARYSDIIENIITLDSSFDYVINVYNQAQRKYHLAKVTGFATVNTDYVLVSVEEIIDRTAFSVNNRIEVNFDVDVEGSSGVVTEYFTFAVSDEDTDLEVGTEKITFRMPYAMTLTDVRASVKTAPTGTSLIVDINESGATILSTKLSIDAGEKTSVTATTPPVISDSSLADDSEITINIDQIGSTIAGTGLKLTFIGTI